MYNKGTTIEYVWEQYLDLIGLLLRLFPANKQSPVGLNLTKVFIVIPSDLTGKEHERFSFLLFNFFRWIIQFGYKSSF